MSSEVQLSGNKMLNKKVHHEKLGMMTLFACRDTGRVFDASVFFLRSSFSSPIPLPQIQLRGLRERCKLHSGARGCKRILTHLYIRVSNRTSWQHLSASSPTFSYDAKCAIPPRFRRPCHRLGGSPNLLYKPMR